MAPPDGEAAQAHDAARSHDNPWADDAAQADDTVPADGTAPFPAPSVPPRPSHANVPVPGAGRLGYIDWLRGLAILIMIEAHVLDAWTLPSERAEALFGWAMMLGGMGAPIFLFLAGVAVVLSADAKERKAGREAAVAAVRRRGWQVFLYAFLFRLQSFLLNPGAPWQSLLKVDILNIMGPSIALAASVLGWVRRGRRVAAYAAATALVAFITPPLRGLEALAVLPDALESYIRPLPSRANFKFLPWAAFVLAGAAAGAAVGGIRDPGAARRRHAWLLLAGVVLAFGAYRASFLPSPYANSNFWTTSPAFFFMRAGILVVTFAAAFFAFDGARLAWPQPPSSPHAASPGTLSARFRRFAPMQRFGRSSLFVYWIHVEMVYGVLSTPLHKALSLDSVILAFVLFTLFLFGLVLVKEQVVARYRRRRMPS